MPYFTPKNVSIFLMTIMEFFNYIQVTIEAIVKHIKVDKKNCGHKIETKLKFLVFNPQLWG